MIELMEHQLDAIDNLKNGSVLYGDVGTGKSVTALAYYAKKERGRDVYVITTAKKRDSGDWLIEAASFGLGEDGDPATSGTITVDSWNNIWRYRDVQDAFFIFDEQRVVGSGAWVKAFIHIARRNHWILLTGTPGDKWEDFAPIFVANGFYKNISEFKYEHLIYKAFMPYPVLDRYANVRKLELLRNSVLVEMPYLKNTTQYINEIPVGYDAELIRKLAKERWHPFEERPIKDAAELWRLMRRVINSDPSRLEMVRFLHKAHPRLIVFYNFNYELDILRSLTDETRVAEWNGHKHESIPNTDEWVYLVQYVAGAEGWNCITTDAMIQYSLSYSYKNSVQARGRIDRLDTPYLSLFYYVFMSNSIVDLSIKKSLDGKQNFNEKKFIESEGKSLVLV